MSQIDGQGQSVMDSNDNYGFNTNNSTITR